MRKSETQTPKTVPNKTLINDQCIYCKDASHTMCDCPKLAQRRKLEEDPNTEKCRNCNTPGNEENNYGCNSCYTAGTVIQCKDDPGKHHA